MDCDLRYLDPAQRLCLADERARYLTHNNDVEDPGYQKFVQPLYLEIKKNSSTQSRGLDFGAGTGPVLTKLLEQDGYSITLYDPIFIPNAVALEQKYDFVFACEVIEHFFDPATEFARFKQLLHRRGFLALMTHLCDETTDFNTWYYRKDPTHVTFYSKKTFQWIAAHFQFGPPSFTGERMILLHNS